MEKYKEQFIELMVRSQVLLFGDFMTKSGRKSPYFINTGNYHTGSQIQQLGDFYADAIYARFGTDFDVLFGPAYKGIPLVIATAIAFTQKYHKEISFCFNRKEEKDHGEGGSLIGKKLTQGDRIVIVEDVITAGTSIRESITLLNKAGFVHIIGLIVAVDRMERGLTEKSALQEVQDQFNILSGAVVNLDEIVQFLYNRSIDGDIIINQEILQKVNEYRALYGIKK
jgi:orotate phosphoribosyltransferase